MTSIEEDASASKALAFSPTGSSPGRPAGCPDGSPNDSQSQEGYQRKPREHLDGWLITMEDAVESESAFAHGPIEHSGKRMDLSWRGVKGGVVNIAIELVRRGLAAWDELPPSVRERMSRWSPLARQLWESPLPCHREAMIRAWIWHYLDDNVIWFSEDAKNDELVPCASPVWEHVRALRLALNGLITGEKETEWLSEHRHQANVMRITTEVLVREGLGLTEVFRPADLIPHFKKSLRPLIVDGLSKIPDRDDDVEFDISDWIDDEASDDDIGAIEISELCSYIKSLLRDAVRLRFWLHGMRCSWRLRFHPLGSRSLWGFPADNKWMTTQGPQEVTKLPSAGERPVRLVQLVSDPMLVYSGVDWKGWEEDFHLWPSGRMRVVAPWSYGGKVTPWSYLDQQGVAHVWPVLEKDEQEQGAKRMQEDVEPTKRPKRARESVGRVTRSMSAKGAVKAE